MECDDADLRRKRGEAYRKRHPEASEADCWIALDYEDFREKVRELETVIKMRDKQIDKLRLSLFGAREVADRFRARVKELEAALDGARKAKGDP